MKNKKSIAMAMAAVSTLGTVAPVFANEVQGRIIITDKENQVISTSETIDERLVAGYEVVKVTNGEAARVFTRAEIFNYNGYAENRDKHTLKNDYKDMKILAQKLDPETPADDLFVLGKKATEEAVKSESTRKELIEAEVAKLIKDKRYTSTEESSEAGIEEGVYTAGTKTITLSRVSTNEIDTEDTITITYTEIDGIKVTEPTENQKETAKTLKLRKEVFGEDAEAEAPLTFDLDGSDADQYTKANTLKYLIESNIDKFDIVKDEYGPQNKGLKVTLYRKDAEKKDHNIVKTIVVNDLEEIDDKKILDIPTTNDFATMWAGDSILKAMAAGQVDASANFRPYDGITRAEFAKIVCTMFGYTPESTDREPFDDVTKADGWKYDYIAALYTKGQFKDEENNVTYAIQGDDDTFRPDDEITRQEVAVILARMISKTELDAPELDAYGDPVYEKIANDKFKDAKEIAAWADHSVRYLSNEFPARYDDREEGTEAKYVTEGSNGKFNPLSNITRAEALVMIERAARANELNARE